ncbi:MAG: chemotaxis protein CheX [Bdellovibrionota bacterium]
MSQGIDQNAKNDIAPTDSQPTLQASPPQSQSEPVAASAPQPAPSQPTKQSMQVIQAKITNKYFEVAPFNGYLTVNFSGDVTRDAAKFLEDMQQQLVFSKAHLIFVCKNVMLMSKQAIRLMLMLKQQLKTNSKHIRLVLVSEHLKSNLRLEGVFDAFKICGDLRGALMDLGILSNKSLDVNFVNPFLAATLNVLQIQAKTESKPGKISVIKPTDKIDGDLTGIIGLMSETFSGTVAISFPTATFINVASRMLGETVNEVTQEIKDVVAELTNIILGMAKAVLNEKGYALQNALPSVVSGQDHNIFHSGQGPVIVIPFESDSGPFKIMVVVNNNDSG